MSIRIRKKKNVTIFHWRYGPRFLYIFQIFSFSQIERNVRAKNFVEHTNRVVLKMYREKKNALRRHRRERLLSWRHFLTNKFFPTGLCGSMAVEKQRTFFFAFKVRRKGEQLYFPIHYEEKKNRTEKRPSPSFFNLPRVWLFVH